MSFSRSSLVRPAIVALALAVPLVAAGAAAAPDAIAPHPAGSGVVSSAASEAAGFGPSLTVKAPMVIAVQESGADGIGGVVVRASFDERAKSAIKDARRTESSVKGKVSDSSLTTAISRLSDFEDMPLQKVDELTRALERTTVRAAQQAVGHDVDAAVQGVVGSAQTIGAQALATAAAQAQAIAEAQAAAARAQMLAQVNTPDGSRAYARDLAASQYGWGDGEFQCLDSLWMKESGWNYLAYNDGSGATGIPQSLPGSKMATFGDDWQTNAATQIAWGLDYIAKVYGSPCSAWGHSQATNWY